MAEKNKTLRKTARPLFFSIGPEKQTFIENLSVLLSSGMDIGSALDAIRAESRSASMRYVLTELIEDIHAGSSLWKALENSKLLNAHVISLVRIGEETGRLSENLKAIALQEQKEQEFKSKVSSAMLYPVFVFGLTMVIGVGIAWFILPRLSTVFASLNIELPLLTRLLIQVGTFLGNYGLIFIPGLILVISLLGYFIFVYRRTNVVGQYILLAFPPVKRLIQEVELSRLGYIMGALLEAGLPIVPALKSLTEATTFHYFKKFYAYLSKSIEDGYSFKQSFTSYKGINGVLPISIQQLVISAEQSGHLPTTFTKIGELYEGKTELSTKNLTVLLEPVLLVIVWLGVVGVALAVILPLYSLVGGLNTSNTPTYTPPVAIVTTPSPTPVAGNRLLISENAEGFINVRDEPGLTGEIIGQVPEGQIYVYTEDDNGWFRILSEGKVASGSANFASGWVFGNLVEVQ